jgi:pimeloyl-ACP methyl ester carboxylesterase
MGQIELKSVELSNRETLGYRERKGGKEVVLLLHGNMTSSKHWDIVLEEMDEKYTLIAVDLRGFGSSSYHQPISSLRDFSDDVKLFVDALGLKDFTLVGWSTGGGVGMHFVADYPGYANKLILLASVSTRGYPFFYYNDQMQPTGRMTTREEIASCPFKTIPTQTAYKNRDKEFLRAVWNAVIYNNNQPSADRYDEYLEDMCTQRNLTDVYHALNTFNISGEHNGAVEGTGDVKKITVPTLVLWGRNDLVVPEQMALDIKNDLGDRAKLVYLENCGHSPVVDDLNQLLKRMTEFIED